MQVSVQISAVDESYSKKMEIEAKRPFYSAKMGFELRSKGKIRVDRCLQNTMNSGSTSGRRRRLQKETIKSKNYAMAERERKISNLPGGAPRRWKLEDVSWNSEHDPIIRPPLHSHMGGSSLSLGRPISGRLP